MPSAAANTTTKKHTPVQDPVPARGRGNKAARHAHAGDAPTSLAPEEHPNGVTVTAGGEKENLNSRPIRTKAGKGGRNKQLEEFLFHIRPDLNKDKQHTRQGQTSFPQNAPENEFAPQKGTRRTSRKNAQMPTTTVTTSSNDPQIRRPEVPEKPLGVPPVPSLHISRAGSELGTLSSVLQDRHTGQAPSEKNQVLAQPPLSRQSDTNSVRSNQSPLESGVGSAETSTTAFAATGREPSQYHFDTSRTLDGGSFDMLNNASSRVNFSDPFARQLGVYPHVASYSDREESSYNDGNFYNGYQSGLTGYQQNNPDAVRHEQDGGSFYQNEFTMPPGSIPSGGVDFTNMHAFPKNGFTQDIQLDLGYESVDLDGPPFEPPENSQARDLFLPEPHGYDSDDALSYCDKPREDDHERDHGDDDIDVDEASPSEDEAIAVAALHAVSPRVDVQYEGSGLDEDGHDENPDANSDTTGTLQAQAEDILQAHRLRNRAQKPPKSSHLKDSASRQTSSSQNIAGPRENDNGDSQSANGESRSDSVKTPRAPRNSKKPTSGDNPETLGFYSPEWASVLGEAQQRWQRHLILGRESPFPVRGEHLHEARRILTDVISERLNAGQPLDDTYARTRAMDICVFAEHSTWRGKLKTIAAPIVTAKYESLITIPDNYHGSQLKAWRIVRERIKDAVEHTSFHIHGTDDNGRTNNFGHPAIPQIIMEFFYTGDKCLATLYPDDFRQAVPVHAVALVVTTIANCLDEWVEYVHKRTTVQFLGCKYSETFDSIMTAINDVKADPYHGAKFEANRRLWARMGMEKLEGKLQMERRRVKLVLD
ncbi:hypothetical protein HYPSUDRAFT_201226 [Hypholoma sublateritium FD-334 SS-4]|uniref:DUF6532 domain-containing protein n=1 Tax=Hypholoma sublateritium (strain FD-334 SS-4) TaxID=945553 RepID=A0A0D2PVB7_HYPSF|nr:hypothetical protein HYPSUDRAFT_201226 [Hypholoma sublateritium FD-334 SS-4]